MFSSCSTVDNAIAKMNDNPCSKKSENVTELVIKLNMINFEKNFCETILHKSTDRMSPKRWNQYADASNREKNIFLRNGSRDDPHKCSITASIHTTIRRIRWRRNLCTRLMPFWTWLKMEWDLFELKEAGKGGNCVK